MIVPKGMVIDVTPPQTDIVINVDEELDEKASSSSSSSLFEANQRSGLDANRLSVRRLSDASSARQEPPQQADRRHYSMRKFQRRRKSTRGRLHSSTDEEDVDFVARERWRDDTSYTRLLAERTTFHGVRDCYYASESGCLWYAWMLIIVFAVFASLYCCHLIVREFISRPVIVSYLIGEADRRGLLLPDIIVCPFNRFNRTYLKSLNVSEGVAQYLELAYPSPILHSFQKQTYREKYRKNLHVYDRELSDLLQRIGNVSFTKFIKQSALDCTAFFENKSVCQNLTEIMTSAGKCFRIPGKYQEVDGFGYGPRFVIRLPQKLYNPGVNQMLNDGIAVKLAESNRGIDHDLTFIPSGVHAIIALSATKYDFMNDPPRYKCEEKVDQTYSRVWCFEMCLMEKAELKCNCSLAASQAAVTSRPRTPEICTTMQYFDCYIPEIFHENMTFDMERCKVSCPSPCTYWEYGKSLSYAHFPSEQARFFVKDEMEWEGLKNTIILEMFYTTLDYTIIKHIQAMTPSGFLAQIGGQISLWIGGSVISLIQIFIYTCFGGYSSLKRRAYERRRRSAALAIAGAASTVVTSVACYNDKEKKHSKSNSEKTYSNISNSSNTEEKKTDDNLSNTNNNIKYSKYNGGIGNAVRKKHSYIGCGNDTNRIDKMYSNTGINHSFSDEKKNSDVNSCTNKSAKTYSIDGDCSKRNNKENNHYEYGNNNLERVQNSVRKVQSNERNAKKKEKDDFIL